MTLSWQTKDEDVSFPRRWEWWGVMLERRGQWYRVLRRVSADSSQIEFEDGTRRIVSRGAIRGEAEPVDLKVNCSECGQVCANEHGFHAHWAQKHWRPAKVRPYPIPAAQFTAEAEEMMRRLNASGIGAAARRTQESTAATKIQGQPRGAVDA